MKSRLYLPLATLAIAIAALYLFDLDGVGVLGPDEPRYAAIGRAMAATHDFVTPYLWGSPWFEKPPLLYWMTALGAGLHWGPEVSGRLPVALLSLAYLIGSCWFLTREYSLRVAVAATALLATSAGWIAYSSLCLTDLPLSVCFSGAVFTALPLLRRDPRSNTSAPKQMVLIGIFIGLGVLAKGLVPIALAAPFAWFLRRYWKNWWIAVAACLVIASPWYGLVYARNGTPFIEDFFWKHHFERLYSASLLHVQPFYYYLPVLIGALFPWTPLAALPFLKREVWDDRRRFLAVVVIFGFLFFSISRNKLPGYLLPLLPSAFLLVASVLETRRVGEIGKRWLIAPAIFIASIPLLAPILPQSLMLGRITSAGLSHALGIDLFYAALPIAVLLLSRRSTTAILLVLCVAGVGIFLKATTYPAIDVKVSARSLWFATRNIAEETCDGGTNRDWIFGLSFYRGKAYSNCDGGKFRYAFRTHQRGVPDLELLATKQK